MNTKKIRAFALTFETVCKTLCIVLSLLMLLSASGCSFGKAARQEAKNSGDAESQIWLIEYRLDSIGLASAVGSAKDGRLLSFAAKNISGSMPGSYNHSFVWNTVRTERSQYSQYNQYNQRNLKSQYNQHKVIGADSTDNAIDNATDNAANNKAGTAQGKQKKVVIFHDSHSGACIQMLRYIHSIEEDCPGLIIEEHLLENREEYSNLLAFKLQYNHSFGQSSSFAYLPITFAGRHVYSGFNTQVSSMIKSDVMNMCVQ